jgi:hypothetical protein
MTPVGPHHDADIEDKCAATTAHRRVASRRSQHVRAGQLTAQQILVMPAPYAVDLRGTCDVRWHIVTGPRPEPSLRAAVVGLGTSGCCV